MNDAGVCPKCKIGGRLDYGVVVLDGGSIYYSVSCPDCGFVGREYYYLEFDTFTDNECNEV